MTKLKTDSCSSPETNVSQNIEENRLKALYEYAILDSAKEHTYNAITQIAAEICNTPASLITFIDQKRQWIKSAHGLDLQETERCFSFCTHAIEKPFACMEVQNALMDDRFKTNPLVVQSPKLRFYAGYPIVTPNGYALGSLCVLDFKPNKLTKGQTTALASLANQVMLMLELRKANWIMAAQQRTLEEKNKSLEKFAYVLSHDLKSPLNNISALCEIIGEDTSIAASDSGLKHLSLIHESANTLRSLIDGVMEYHLGAGSEIQGLETIDMQMMLNRLATLFEGQAKIKIDMNPTVIKVNSIPSVLQQIIINLLTNGIKYNLKETPTIQINCHKVNNDLIVAVTDDGMGMTPDQIPRIFELFATLGVKDRNSNKGTGIGLATVNKLVKQLGGKIEVASMPGVGSTFTVTIPV